MSKKLYILFLFGFLIISGADAQFKGWEKALKAYQEDNLIDAMKYSDESILDEAEKNNAYTWHVRGFVYRAAYKKIDNSDTGSKSREIAIDAFMTSIKLDKEKEFETKNTSAIINLAKTFFNDAVRALSYETYQEAVSFYERYKEVTRLVSPDFNFVQTDIDFNNTLAGIFSRVYENDKQNQREYLEKAVQLYLATIKEDSLNYNANYNVGILYYNQGVDLILSIDPEAPLPVVIETQEMCAALFVKSLPYMKRAYSLKPTNRETIVGLAGIYFNLNDSEKSKFFSDLLKEIEDSEPNRPDNKK